MDFCRNMSVSGGLPSEYPPEQVLASPCSKLGGLGGSLDDLFSGQSTEVDVSLEWLSIFVEDCFSSTGQCLPAVAPTITNVEKKTSTAVPKPSKPLPQHNPPSLQKFVFPSKARSKRRRATAAAAKARSWAHHLNPQTQQMTTSSDPPLLQQAYWLADSELILPKKEESISQEEADTNKEGFEGEEGQQEEEMVMVMVGSKNSPAGSLEGSNGQPRRCTHCLSQRTPQWRAGPLGPKTLCNACGVRYKSGRLLPEYRPAKSPTFVSYLHSNSHKKVMEMRMSLPSSIPSEHEQ